MALWWPASSLAEEEEKLRAAVGWPQQSELSASLLVVHAVPTREPDKNGAGKRKK
jgi:hypothetical protein